jgi:hypothetical protein
MKKFTVEELMAPPYKLSHEKAKLLIDAQDKPKEEKAKKYEVFLFENQYKAFVEANPDVKIQLPLYARKKLPLPTPVVEEGEDIPF